jgi:AraC-like DNA-binding protein
MAIVAIIIDVIKKALDESVAPPFSVYTSFKEQKLLNVPIAKPLLIVVLNGNKELGFNGEVVCETGQFVFLSNNSAIDMRNIPEDKEYFALLIEFEFEDFNTFTINSSESKPYYIGKVESALMECLQQFIECSPWATKEIASLRKQEILALLCHLGHNDILSLLASPQLKNKLHDMFIEKERCELSVQDICQQLAMSESTLRRKLRSESTNVQEIKDSARLGLSLHLLQTTHYAIGIIADKCGYQSQSRFTERFKKQFGLTPTELRKTKMTE